jgi:glycosyltransferase involved in cell wall biosynthesis
MAELVSVIMPTFNSGPLLKDSIDSILNQTYSTVELLITDDHSTDQETLDILRYYNQRDARVDVVFLDTNHGPGYARDHSIGRAKGRYIAFCDSDDRWFPEKLERQIKFMDEKQCALSYTSYILCDVDNQERGIVIAPKSITFSQLKRDNQIGCLTAVYDTKLLGRKYPMPHIRKRQDWGLFLTILSDCGIAYAITEPLAYYRIRQDSVSRNKFGLIKYNIRIYHRVLGYSSIKSHAYFFFLFLPTHFKKVLKKYYDSWLFLHHKKTFLRHNII